ncbi:hypothetical protein HYX17_03835 [Candidatus Woesearchaeota archaeon]|nr:hypothetical protein [Candidatus Woesearchaeota archaeon]
MKKLLFCLILILVFTAGCKQRYLETNNAWKTDSVTLMRIPETGDYQCFGCGRTMCIDPIPGLEDIEETQELHCDEDFNVVRK